MWLQSAGNKISRLSAQGIRTAELELARDWLGWSAARKVTLSGLHILEMDVWARLRVNRVEGESQ